MRTASLILTALVSLSPVLPAVAGDDTQQLLSLEHRWLDASMQRDIPALHDILADDFIDVTYKGGLRNKADHLQSSLAPSKTRQSLDELKVRFYGDTGIVTGLNTIVALDGSFTAEIRFTDVFVKHDGRWQAVSAQETPVMKP